MAADFKLMSDAEIKDVLDKDLLEILKMQGISEDAKAEFYEKMTQTIQNRVICRIDNRLNDAERQEWLELIDQNDHDRMEGFLKAKNIDIAKLMVEEAIVYKMQIASLLKQAQAEEK